MKKFFPKIRVKDICVLGLLIAITTILAVFGTFRIGEFIKIPIKFISIFITAVLYGPIYGGLVATLGDLLNCLLAPSGAILPQITVIEFLNGFIFGLFFLNNNGTNKNYVSKTVLCTVALFCVDMFTWWLGWFPSFEVAFVTRIAAGLIKAAMHFVVIYALKGYIGKLRRLKK